MRVGVWMGGCRVGVGSVQWSGVRVGVGWTCANACMCEHCECMGLLYV